MSGHARISRALSATAHADAWTGSRQESMAHATKSPTLWIGQVVSAFPAGCHFKWFDNRDHWSIKSRAFAQEWAVAGFVASAVRLLALSLFKAFASRVKWRRLSSLE